MDYGPPWSHSIAYAGQLLFNGVPVDITTAANEDLVIAPGGDGNTQIGDATGTNSYATSNDDLHITGILEVDGAAYFDSTATFASSFNPSSDSTSDLGSSTLAWRYLYVDTISGYNAALALSPASGYSLTGSVTKSASTGNEVAYDLAATINKATSGNYTGLKLNVTETSAPGTADKLLDLQVSSTSRLQAYNGTNSANYGLLSVGTDDWDGSTSGFFNGSANGTQLAINAVTGFTGNLIDAQVAGSSKFSVDASGNVTAAGTITGAGGSAPTDAQYVTLATNGTLSAERVLQGTSNQITVTDGGAGGNVTLSTPQDIATSSAPQFARLGLGAAADATNILTATSVDPILRVRNTGDTGGAFIGDTYNTLQIGLYNPSGSAWGVVGAGASRSFFGCDNNGKVGSFTNNFGSPTFRNVLDDGNGRIGIGTSTPDRELEIRNASGLAAFRLRGTGDDWNFSSVELYSDEATDKIWYIHHRKTGTELNNFVIEEYNGSEYNQRLVIQDGGNVGIGTMAPQNKLDVAGTVQMTGFKLTAAPTAGHVLTSDASGVGTWQSSGGWHGSSTRIKILPSDFLVDDVSDGSEVYEVHETNKGVRVTKDQNNLCAFVSIPTAYKATHVRIYGNNATNTITVYESNIDNGTWGMSLGSGAMGTEIDITDVNNTSTNFLVIGVNVDSKVDVIYGGYVTISRI